MLTTLERYNARVKWARFVRADERPLYASAGVFLLNEMLRVYSWVAGVQNFAINNVTRHRELFYFF